MDNTKIYVRLSDQVMRCGSLELVELINDKGQSMVGFT